VIVVDTSVLSLAFRRPTSRDLHPAALELKRLVLADEAIAIPGVVLQEILSGIRFERAFSDLLGNLEGFPLLLAKAADHVLAGRIRNRCVAAGIAASAVDALIAAQTISARGRLFTLDEDFAQIAPVCNLELYRPP
jgi:predicted nucleic acid-binding protein